MMIFALAIALSATVLCEASLIKCRCKRAENCGENGYCRSGCKPGFNGPGCQISNVAYKKDARQSSTYPGYPAELAVDGFFTRDPSQNSAPNCSHTLNQEEKSWWQVILSGTQKYLISNITIINRVAASARRLRNFTIYLSNDTATFPSGSWKFCYHQPEVAPFQSSYACEENETNIGTSLVIELEKHSDSFLTLCEVIIDGSEYFGGCPKGYAGPNCMLLSCDHEDCIKEGQCGPFHACQFSRCPGNEHLPPDCWMTLPNFATLNWKTEFKKGQTIMTGIPKSRTNLQANNILLNVFASGTKLDYSRKFKSMITASGVVEVILETLPDMVFDISLTPAICFETKTCDDGHNCFEKPDCIEGPSSRWITVDRAKIQMGNGCGKGYGGAINVVVLVILMGSLARSVLEYLELLLRRYPQEHFFKD